jgi:DNA polymerase elongation subunit (family B)
VGMLYEKDVNKCKRKEMGIVLKRRDNAPIVKDVYGGIIDVLMKEQDLVAAMGFLKHHLQCMIEEKCPMDKLIISKSLRSHYKIPQSIAHKVLADRIAEREPGNKPSSGDRIPYVYIVKEGKKVLQGERIETPSFIIEKSLKIDYSHYITNQIMKPVQQLFALVLEDIYTINKKMPKLRVMQKNMEEIKKKYAEDPVKMEKKIAEYRAKEIKALLFDEFLIVANNKNNGMKSMKDYFK